MTSDPSGSGPVRWRVQRRCRLAVSQARSYSAPVTSSRFGRHLDRAVRQHAVHGPREPQAVRPELFERRA
ncbi:hypothetical protein LV779_15595 [Streptomyces thinghirensis]|nr:hypothetical protein [Streptomyces thinghirensis]